jgi:predicted dehydrogenase
MAEMVRVALVGCGGVARLYRRIYGRLPGVRVVAIVDVDEKEAAEAAREIADQDGGPECTTDFGRALRGDIDVAVVSTPNHLHREQATALAAAGAHLFLQKPMARTVAECDEILDAAAGKVVGVYMNLLDHPLYRDLREMVRSGYLGRIGLVSARLAHRGGLGWQASERLWRSSRSKTGGGCYVQLGIHYQHLLRWILAEPVVRVQAMMQNRACPHLEGDDLAMAQFELASGIYAEVQTSWCVQEEHFSILGTRGAIHYRDNRRVEYIGEGGPFNGQILRLKGDGQPETIDPLLPPAWDDAENPFNQHRAFFEAFVAGRSPEVTGLDGREDVRIIEAIHLAAAEGRAVRL